MLRGRCVRSVQAAAGVIVVVTLLELAGLPAASSAGPRTPVMGRSELTARQLVTWYRRHHGSSQPRIPALHNDVGALAQLFLDAGASEGVRGDIAFVQATLETGWFSFDRSQIPPDAYNYGGLYAYDGRPTLAHCGASTAGRCMGTPQHGVLVQIELLRSYADRSTRHMRGRLISAPRDRVGAAPVWEDFGRHNCRCHKLIWASAHNYGKAIVARYREALDESGVTSTSAGDGEQQLAIGARGEAVKELQRELNELSGSHLVVDGAFGPRTAQAVKNRQYLFGISSDGIVGHHTWVLLDYLAAVSQSR